MGGVRPLGKSFRLRYTEKSGQQCAANIGDATPLKLTDARSVAQGLGRRPLLGEGIQARPDVAAPETAKTTLVAFLRDRIIPCGRMINCPNFRIIVALSSYDELEILYSSIP